MKRSLFHAFAFTTLLLCTSSCKDLTHVQTGYISDRDDCHSRAQYGVGSYTADANAISGKDKNNMLLQLFCECMKDREWSVAGCKFKDNKAIAATPQPQQQPTVIVVQAPAAAASGGNGAGTGVEACPAPPPGKKRVKRRVDGTCAAPEEYGQTELDNVLNRP